MKAFYFTIICLVLFLFSCEKERVKEETTDVEEISQIAEEKTASAFNLPKLNNDYLVSIYEAQELIKIGQDDVELRQLYCEKAYLEEHNIFISMGIAKQHNPKDGSAIPLHMAERAAKLDAVRWAGYGEKWLKNNYQPAFGQLQTRSLHPIKIINTASVGDSLFVFLATKMP
jgi:hypothetical protein